MQRKRSTDLPVILSVAILLAAVSPVVAGISGEGPVSPDGWWGSSQVVLPGSSDGLVVVSASGESLQSLTRAGLVDGSVAVESLHVFPDHAVASFAWSSEVVIVTFEVAGGGLRPVSLEHRAPGTTDFVDLADPGAGAALAGIVSPAFEDALHAFSMMDQPDISGDPAADCQKECPEQCKKYPKRGPYGICMWACKIGCLIGARH